MTNKAQDLQQLISLSRRMLEKAREESWDDVLHWKRSGVNLSGCFFRAGSAGGCRCGRDPRNNGDRSRHYGIGSSKDSILRKSCKLWIRVKRRSRPILTLLNKSVWLILGFEDMLPASTECPEASPIRPDLAA